jgi:hypothetical protein
MTDELRKRIIEYNKSVKAKDSRIEELKAEIEQRSETMRTIANSFSNTLWNALPQKIKAYFEEYRNT